MHNNMPTHRTVSSKKLIKIAQSAKKQATQRPVFLEEAGTSGALWGLPAVPRLRAAPAFADEESFGID
jgi:hypothetical protein